MFRVSLPRPLPFTPCFVNNDYIISEITYSNEHAHHKVPTWSWATLCGTPVWASLWKPWLPLRWRHTGETPQLCCVRFPYGSVMATLWACCSCCYSCCVSQAAMAAVPAKREQGCLQFLRLLKPPSSILGWVLPNLGSANTVGSVNSKVTGIMKRISNAMMWCMKDLLRPMR